MKGIKESINNDVMIKITHNKCTLMRSLLIDNDLISYVCNESQSFQAV